jgi:hypothetical protein
VDQAGRSHWLQPMQDQAKWNCSKLVATSASAFHKRQRLRTRLQRQKSR